jgi:hypothetical protein
LAFSRKQAGVERAAVIGMDWLPEYEEELAELMADYPQIAPAVERAVRIEDQIADIVRRLETLEGRNPLLESIRERMKGDHGAD